MNVAYILYKILGYAEYKMQGTICGIYAFRISAKKSIVEATKLIQWITDAAAKHTKLQATKLAP